MKGQFFSEESRHIGRVGLPLRNIKQYIKRYVDSFRSTGNQFDVLICTNALHDWRTPAIDISVSAFWSPFAVFVNVVPTGNIKWCPSFTLDTTLFGHQTCIFVTNMVLDSFSQSTLHFLCQFCVVLLSGIDRPGIRQRFVLWHSHHGGCICPIQIGFYIGCDVCLDFGSKCF